MENTRHVMECAADEIVFKRQRKKVIYNDITKRVSFNEDVKFLGYEQNLQTKTGKGDTPEKCVSKQQKFPPFRERGVPEGREDPYTKTESNFVSEIKSLRRDIESGLFKARNSSILPAPFHKNVSVNNKVNDAISMEIWNEIDKNAKLSEDDVVSFEFCTILFNRDERVYKVFRCLTTNGLPLWSVVSNCALYFVKRMGQKFDLERAFPFDNLIGLVLASVPNILIVVDASKRYYILNTSAVLDSAVEICVSIEIAVRRWRNTRKEIFDWSVARLQQAQDIKVFHNIISFGEIEREVFQCWIWLQEDYIDDTSSVMTKIQGHLMINVGGKKWSPAFVALKDGRLCVFEKSLSIPTYTVPLENCGKLRMASASDRPYSFEVLTRLKEIYKFGTANAVELSEWMNVLLYAISKYNLNPNAVKKNSTLKGCFASITTDAVILYQYPNLVISRECLKDITSFQRSEHPFTYMMLEFGCREACESGGDWILHFACQPTCDKFYKVFTGLNSNFSTEANLSENASFKKACDEINMKIKNTWL